jgi:hypothetical protein
LFTSSKKEREIITPPVSPMRKPKDRLPGVRRTAKKPPKPVPKLATKLKRKIFRITLII